MNDGKWVERLKTRFRANWGFIVAGVALLAVLGFLEYRTDQFQQRVTADAQSAEKSERLDQFASPRSGLPATAERIASNTQHQSDRERQARDLAAQESMAVWAFWAAIFAAMTTLAALLGLYWIRGTFAETKRAVDEAADATAAMIDANAIARESNERQLRAYVGIKEDFAVSFEPGGRPEFIVEYINSGQTPARFLTILVEVVSVAKGPYEAPVRFSGTPERSSTHSLAPNTMGSCNTLLPRSITKDEYETIMRGDAALIMCAQISYRDIFGKLRRTLHTSFVSPTRVQGAKAYLLNLDRGNRMT